MEIKCPDCGEYYKDTFRECPSCYVKSKKPIPAEHNAAKHAKAEKICRHRAMGIPTEAKICPYCRKKQGTSVFTAIAAVIGFFFVAGFIGFLIEPSKPSRSTSSYTPATPAKETEPVLEVQSWRWYEEHTYAIAEGAVKNISSRSLDNVVAFINIYDKQGSFIKADRALTDYRPILPGQTSPFKVMSSFNPEMAKASIDFKTFAGGYLPWKEKGERKK